ncbi:MAG: DUF1564 family protein [Spirochaetales bacterium]|nr:DUF1564 family protein [Leptospiraceae bacterium]MCP5481570.1 DUF1564 family protein [Spirochaetales bacterium]MCP5484398.1 DUF1564 family protein [Spirochaetales bacterium]
MPLFYRRLRGRKLAEYLPVLIKLARRQAGRLPVFPKFTAEYQEDGQDLQRINFRPAGQDWGEFKLIARGCSVSMCYLFVFLLLLEDELSRNGNTANEVSLPYRLALNEIARNSGVRFVRRLFFARE